MNITEVSIIEILYTVILFAVSYVIIVRVPQPAWIIVVALATLTILSTVLFSYMQSSIMTVLNANMDTAMTLFAFFLIVASAQFVMLLQRFTFFETMLIILFIALFSSPVTAYLATKNPPAK